MIVMTYTQHSNWRRWWNHTLLLLYCCVDHSKGNLVMVVCFFEVFGYNESDEICI